MHDVFVYGTLKRGFPNFDAGGMQDARFIGRYQSLEPFPLVIGGRWFTPYMIDEPETGHRVRGELFEVTDSLLSRLDAFESVHLPDGYHRRSIRIEAEDNGESRPAWAYLRDRAKIDGIHTEPLTEYPLDPRYILPSDRRRST